MKRHPSRAWILHLLLFQTAPFIIGTVSLLLDLVFELWQVEALGLIFTLSLCDLGQVAHPL